MKRYIEIVYDNSVSMNDTIGYKTKYQIAQELFEKEILPTLALPGDHVMLRLLADSCMEGTSSAESLTDRFGTNRNAMLERLRAISHDRSTPLFYTIYDAIQACKHEKADQYLIFVLTDGDDTCNRKIEDIIDQDLIDKYVKFYNVLLVQLAVDSPISSNNLTACASYLGGQSITLDKDASVITMRKTMKKALRLSGFSSQLPLEHCYDSQPGFDKDWTDIESLGIDFHQALLLYNKDMLSWKPDISIKISALQLAELQFLFALIFKSGMPDALVMTMLAQLKKPYYYSHDCIYWDFAAARWKYFIPQNTLHRIDNPDTETVAELKDNFDNDYEEIDHHHRQNFYREGSTYEVKMQSSLFEQSELFNKYYPDNYYLEICDNDNETEDRRPRRRAKKLKLGDIVKFTEK